MGDTLQNVALLALGQELRGDVVRQINRRSAFLRMIPIVPGAGQNCAWAVENSGQVAENFSDGADASNFGSDGQAQALIVWGKVRSNFHVSGSARRVARSAQAGPGGIRSLIGRNMVNSSAAVASKVNGQLFSGLGTGDQLAGLDAAIGSASNTYASIDRSQGGNAYWRPTVVDPGVLTAPTFQQIRNDRSNIYIASGFVPDIAIVEPLLFDKIGGLYDANRRYVQQVNTARGIVTLDAGFEGLELDGMVFIKDKDATANQIYYINSDFLELQYLPPDDGAMADAAIVMKADDGYGATPLGIQCTALAKNGDSDRYMCLAELQLVVRRPNAFGVRKNVANS